jgi:acyl-CoA dehydrogenase
MIRTSLSPDFDDVVDGIKEFVKQEVIPRHKENASLFDEPGLTFERSGHYTPRVLDLIREVRTASAEAGYYSMFVPSDLGGAGLGYAELFSAYKTLFHECGPQNWIGHHMIGHWAKGPSVLFAAAKQAVREAVLPSLLSGHASLCFALSEPDAGSDVWMMRTTADRVPGGWQLNGCKQWITNGPYADFALLFAVTDMDAVKRRTGGITAFLVPTDNPGFEISSVIRMFGAAGGDEAIIMLDDVYVQDDWILGEVGQGLRTAMLGISIGKLYNSGKAIGYASWALDQASQQLSSRQTFGQPLWKHQGIVFPIAESLIELHAATLLALNAAQLLDSGVGAETEVAMAKAYSAEMSYRTIDRVMQAHGGLGFTNEMGLFDAWHATRKIMMADGSAEMMRRQIVRAFVNGKVPL